MDRSDFNYELPLELIAQQPLSERGASRLLVLRGDNGERQDRQFMVLPELLRSGDLLVLNDTRVIPARLHGRKLTGGKVEVLIERLTGTMSALAQVRASKSPRAGGELFLPGDAVARIEARAGEFFERGPAGDASAGGVGLLGRQLLLRDQLGEALLDLSQPPLQRFQLLCFYL